VVVILILLIAIGGATWYRRWHLMVHDPEKYERFQEAETKFAKVQVAATERAAKGLLAVLRAATKFIIGKLFKKKDSTPSMLGDRQWN
jgi:hypothetical protein